nr:oligosaccharide flippase family protein [Marivirga sericea]
MGFIFTPIITRIYLPEDYGAFAFFNTILALTTSISTLNYSEALLIPKRTRDFYKLGALVLVVSIMFSLLFTLVLLFFSEGILMHFEMSKISGLIYFIPFLIIISAFQKLADFYLIRRKRFAINSRSRIISVTTGKSAVAILGLTLGSSPNGLVVGEFIIRLVNLASLLGKNIIRFPYKIIRSIRQHELMSIARAYKNYPKYVFPASVLLQISIHIPVFIISTFHSNESLGFYSLAITLLGLPIQVIGFSVGKVYFQKANETFNQKGIDSLTNQIILVFYGILIIASLGYGVFFVFSEEIFLFIAGDTWKTSGTLARVLSFAMVFQLIEIVIKPTYLILNRQKRQLAADLLASLIYMFILLIGAQYITSLYELILLLSVSIFVRYLISIVSILALINSNSIKHAVLGTFLIISFFLLLSLIF